MEILEVVPDGTKTIIDIASLDDLGSPNVTVEIERDNQVFRFPARMLTWAEWRAVERDIVKPVPPSRGSPKGLIYQRDDPAYLDALEDANYQVGMARLVKFLQIDIPGKTVDEQITMLQNKLDRGIVAALLTVMGQQHSSSKARIIDRANGF